MESSVPYFKAALLARLSVVVAAGGVAFWGNPHPAVWPAKVLLIGDTSNRAHTYVCGMSQCNEEYDVELVANAAGAAANANATNQIAAYALMNAVETSLLDWTVAADPLCSGAWGQVNAAVPGAGSDGEGLDESGRDATVKMLVHVVARMV